MDAPTQNQSRFQAKRTTKMLGVFVVCCVIGLFAGCQQSAPPPDNNPSPQQPNPDAPPASDPGDETPLTIPTEVPPSIQVEPDPPTVIEKPETEPATEPAKEPVVKNKTPLAFPKWKVPQVAIVLTGRQHGYLEPCGCTGLANQKGGLSRKFTLLKQVRELGWETIALDAGNQVRRFGKQPEIKFQTTIDAMKKMGYSAIAYGPDDLRLSSDELVVAAIGTDAKPAPFTSANANLLDQTAPYIVAEVAGKKIGIVSVLGERELVEVTSDEIETTTPQAALKKRLPELLEKKCDWHILLAQTTIDVAKKLAAEFDEFDIVVTTGGAGEPTGQPEPIEGSDAVLIQVGKKGMYTGVIGLYDDETPLQYERVALDDRFEDAPEMLKMLAAYQQQLEAVGLEGLAIKPVPHPSGYRFVGSKACADCHEDEFDIWKDSTHSHATHSLTHPPERKEIARHFDPECLSCHVTGWSPQKFFPFESGYLDLVKSKLMHNVGCENCHGPGSAHVAAENDEIDTTDEKLEELRKHMTLSLKDAQKTCLKCHDLDNSPDFHSPGAFEEYWEQIEH